MHYDLGYAGRVRHEVVTPVFGTFCYPRVRAGNKGRLERVAALQNSNLLSNFLMRCQPIRPAAIFRVGRSVFAVERGGPGCASSSRIGASFKNARAMAMRWRWPTAPKRRLQ